MGVGGGVVEVVDGVAEAGLRDAVDGPATDDEVVADADESGKCRVSIPSMASESWEEPGFIIELGGRD